MKCIFEDMPETTDERGWRKVRCVRCKLVTGRTPYPLDDVHSQCQALPFASEFGNWLELIVEALFITKRPWLWLKWRLGFRPACNCDERIAKLNAIGKQLTERRPD